MRTFNYFTDTVNPVLPQVKITGIALRFIVRDIAATLDWANKARLTGSINNGSTHFYADSIMRSEDAFETIMSYYQSMEQELKELRAYKSKVESFINSLK